MRKVIFRFSTGWIGDEEEEVFHFEDGTSDADIQYEFDEWLADMMNDIDYGWEEI